MEHQGYGQPWTPRRPPPCRAVNSSWRTIPSSSLISSGTKPSTPLRKTAGGCCATWFATSSPQTSSSSPAVWAKGSVQSTQESQAWRDDRSTPSKSAASEVHGLKQVCWCRRVFALSFSLLSFSLKRRQNSCCLKYVVPCLPEYFTSMARVESKSSISCQGSSIFMGS